ncbi:phosphatidylinositol-4-phosphate 5-kinase [Babesia caballi]|uniref:Phosphatidylinositol-4-phosphate 5-kinase n=1 Tax=Babesia caballi TaxID=5871 RepID=A0AAV4LZM2_BABCB|nr:phosphatidylinositol-4-phosphate 5-kinase [Babesia caballi]
MRCFRRRKPSMASAESDQSRDDETPTHPSRTSTIQSQTLDLVSQQTMIHASGTGEDALAPCPSQGPAANWESLDYSNGADYLGWTYAGKREGSGKIQKDDLVYEGQWQADLPHGDGLFAGEGTIYEGQWDHGLPHGHGVAMLPDGSKYVGEWCDGACSGEGKLVTEDGRVYAGAFSDGLPNGEGVLVTAEGMRVRCHFIDGAPFGIGEIEWPDGMRYVGTIIDGLPHGLGRLTNENSVCLGLWKAGVLETRLKAHGSIPDALRDDPAVKYLAAH